ncbi:MAG TPA: DDE-type integrase/transposase/recombinase [Ruania sp.]|nr:DDE-type integrase/transposase/recombinase [Ruania sp.]
MLCAAAHNTYVSIWSGWVYVASVIDAYARRILDWAASTSMSTCFVLAPFERAVWERSRHGQTDFRALVHHHDNVAQHTPVRFGQALAQAGIAESVGATGDSYDNALAETTGGLYKTELIKSGKL